ncbi:involucrin repeat protein [Moniliophthora roreri]|uniref:Up-regulated during septation protein 1 domain-containing protein n=1 Tax=Moniliophthora roreri TaxID=221103 RepID=A0A0W0FC88_MONRR|nr:involucrin repeat protein [Moniliophthora roreri]
MNGVRRFLAGVQQSSTSPPPEPPPAAAPLNISKSSSNSSPGPSWPPQSPTLSPESSPISPKLSSSVPALSFTKNKKQPPLPPLDEPPSSGHRSQSSKSSVSLSPISTKNDALPPIPGPSSPPQLQRPPISRVQTRKPAPSPDPEINGEPSGAITNGKRSSGPINMRDELLLSLLASEAVVDSREFTILSAEDVEELKKEHHLLTTRLAALSKKLKTETKIRDAAISLAAFNKKSSKAISKKTNEQLDAAERRVELTQKEYYKIAERTNEVGRRLAEHRAGVLGWSVRALERKISGDTNGKGKGVLNGFGSAGTDSGYDSTPMSPATSVASSALTNGTSAFDGQHFFAGHAKALQPTLPFDPSQLAAQLAATEEKLKAAESSLATSQKKQAELSREFNMMKLEKTEVEMELERAEETIGALEAELPGLEEERNQWDAERQHWEEERSRWDVERRNWEEHKRKLESERTVRGEEKDKIARDEMDAKEGEIIRLQDELDRARQENDKTSQDLNSGVESLSELVQRHSVSIRFSRSSTTSSHTLWMGMIDALDNYLSDLKSRLESLSSDEESWTSLRRKLEDDLRSSLDKREALSRDLEVARREREDSRGQVRDLETRIKDLQDSTSAMLQSPSRTPLSLSTSNTLSLPQIAWPTQENIAGDTAAQKIVAILQPIFAVLPSPETRAARANVSTQRGFRPGGPTSPSSPSAPGSPVYFNRELSSSAPGTPGTPSHPPQARSIAELDVRSLKLLYDSKALQLQATQQQTPFSVEAFVQRVHSLLVDDRALIERLLRFAHAHDMLKQNADRAKKLAQESGVALETYQRQVRMLEERCEWLGGRLASAESSSSSTQLEEEVRRLQDAYGELHQEKGDLERELTQQGEVCKQLAEANNVLNAKLSSSASGSDQARREVEAAQREMEMLKGEFTNAEQAKKELEGKMTEIKKALDEAREEVDVLRRSEQSQSMMLMEELNNVQTENGKLREQLRALKR